MKDAPDRVGSWFLAIIYTGGRAPGAWRLAGAGAIGAAALGSVLALERGRLQATWRLLRLLGHSQKVQSELHLGKVQFAQHPHAKHPAVKIQSHCRVFHPQHGVVQYKAFRVGGGLLANTGVFFSGKRHGYI
jgi:hypothetical protein